MSQSSLFMSGFSCFTQMNCCKPLVTLQSSEKVDFDYFCPHCFLEEKVFRDLSSAIPLIVVNIICDLKWTAYICVWG